MSVIDVQDAFFFTKRIEEKLQVKAAGETGSKAVSALLFLHARVQSALLLDGLDSTRDALLQSGFDAMRKSNLHGDMDPTTSSLIVADMAQEVKESRSSILEQDMSYLLGQPGISDTQSLSLVIKSLREREGDVELHRKLACEVATVVESTDYEDTNFALGSTPLSSFLILMSHDALSQTLMKKDKAMVWGSSIGWLAFYLLLASGFSQVIGMEILGTLHNIAMLVKAQVGAMLVKAQVGAMATARSLQFHCMDLLQSDLSGVDLLIMTDWCWDKDLVDKATVKIASELGQDAIVISYRGRLKHPNLKLKAQVTAPVSWNPNGQTFSIYQNKG